MEKSTLSKHKPRKSAFTLIEILVASVIMVILVGLVIQITSEVLKVWNRASGKLSANAEARVALDLITQDLETAVLRSRDKQWLFVDSANSGLGPYGGQTVAVRMFSPARDRDTNLPGDICGIAYELDFRGAYEGSTDETYVLYRKVFSPEDTFNALMEPSAHDDISNGWGAINEDSNYLVSNIVEFKVILYGLDPATGDAVEINWNPGAYEFLPGAYGYGGSAGNIDDKLLYADIYITVVSDQGLEFLQNIANGTGGTGYSNVDDIVREHGEIFTRRVNFLTSQ
ncbi:MAG: PulJ/GspJ family protein [Lentimonas sp.]